MFRALILVCTALVAVAQWGAVNEPPCMSCGNKFKTPEDFLEEDKLTYEKKLEEDREDKNCRRYGIARFSTEGLYESLDRLDNSLRSLLSRRASQAKMLKRRENGNSINFGDGLPIR